jgi:predicted MFS family arabinose efflux permease
VFACVIGGIYLIRTRRDRRKGVLMIAMALVLLGNVLIWTM